jgi:hypothetical protein
VKPENRFPDAAAMRRELDLFLAHEVKVSHSALLVSFLRHRQKLTETEALAHLTHAELSVLEAHAASQRSRSGQGKLRWVAAIVLLSLATAAGVYLTQDKWVPLVQQKSADPGAKNSEPPAPTRGPGRK